jgi:hypothetical protein
VGAESLRARSKRPIVVFVDADGWTSFDQVAIALRRRGLHVVRIITGPLARCSKIFNEPLLRWAADRLFYDEVISLSDDPTAADRVFALLASRRVVDVITTEPTLRQIGLASLLGRALTARSLSFSGTAPEVLLDKFAVNARLARAGFDVPRQAGAHDLSPSDAVDLFGLPLVIKSAMGAAGHHVRIANSMAEIHAALNELGHADVPLFYQEHVCGKVVLYGAIVGPEGPRFEYGFRIEQTQYARGPAALASLYNPRTLLDAGRQAVEIFKPQGFASFEFIETEDGRLLHIDANIRPWGMIAVALHLGIDFAKAYAGLFGHADVAPAPPPEAAGPLPVFPHALFEAADTGGPGQFVATAARLGGCLRGLGVRYCAQIFAQALIIVGRRIGRRGLRARPERQLRTARP